MMNKSNPFRHLAVTGILCLLAASCSDVTDDGATLPDGTYPMTFSASVDGLTATRATVDNTWANGDRVAVQVANEVKEYTAATGGSLSVANGVTPFYWQNTSSITVNAWYPYNATKPAAADLKVKANQSENNSYQASDYLEAVAATVTFYNPALTFKHRTAKVVVTLTAGEGVTDLTGAAVTFVSQIGVENSGTEVTPKTGTADNGGATSYTALVIPQQMQNKQFIKVTIGAGDAARDYFYIPTGNNDANLEAGKQYNYTITVKKTGLQVESVTASWNDDTQDGNATSATFQVHLPANHGLTLDISGATQIESSDVYTINDHANTFSISYTMTNDNKMKGFPVTKGLGNCTRTVTNNGPDNQTYIFTYNNIRSDIWLAYALYAEAGDYYYNDGTWSPNYDSGSSPTCIGIVFKAGAAENDQSSNYGENKLTDNTIHGYVVALQDAHNSTCAWGGDGVLIGTSTNQDDFIGYSNTKKIIAKAQDGNHLKPDNAKDDYPAAYYISEYDKISSAPQSSSGWYFPSTGQLKEIYNVKGNIHNEMLSLQSGDYLSSSEFDRGYPAFNVGCVSFANGNSSYKEKDDGPAYVRAILTF